VIAKLSKKLRSLLYTPKNRLIGKNKLSITAFGWGQAVLAASVLATSTVLAVSQLGGLQLLELAAYDQMVRLQPDVGPDPRLLVVAITEADIQSQNRWPLSDQTLAQLLEKLNQYQPQAIGIDLYRNIPVPPGQEALSQQLQASNIITITKLGSPETEGVPSLAGVPETRIGFNDFVIDPDGVVRRNFMYAFQDNNQFYSFSLRLSLNYLAAHNTVIQITPEFLRLGQTTFAPLNENSGGYHKIDNAGYQVMLSYRSVEHVARQITLTQVLNGQIDPAWVKDKIVLIGTTAPSLKDSFFTPYSPAQTEQLGMPGVLLHAQLVSQILSTALDHQPLFWFWPQWGKVGWIWVWSLAGGLLAWRLQHPRSIGLVGLGALGSLWGICFGVFTQAGWIPLIPPAIAFVLTGGSIVAYKLLHNAFHDALTGLPNRAFFLQRLRQAIADTKSHKAPPFAVLFLDLDRFKLVNDSLGHQTGDQLLVDATHRLQDCLRDTDTIARVGGDEFAILLEGIIDVIEVNHVADRLQKAMVLPFRLSRQDIFTSVSVGIALNQAEHDHTPEELLRNAHTATYRAKVLGKPREIFVANMRDEVIRRLQLETDLRRALEQGEFQLHYQPIVALTTGKIAGFEALVRWKHPQRGFVSPIEFIPLSEETRLIIPLGQWVFQEACQQLQIWQTQFPGDPPLMISINLSGEQFSQPDLVESIEQILQITKLDGRNVKLEITESVAMHDVESTIALLLRLRSLNLRVSIDDFGTGYSSLSYLHRFPVDTLKVDRSFVSRMGGTGEDTAIVQTIVVLSHTLGMDVVAEGVETEAQRTELQALNCEYGQGYLFSKPLDSEAATALLATQQQQP
jgi:diguanylate cyclase (GGDEF)-like protein